MRSSHLLLCAVLALAGCASSPEIIRRTAVQRAAFDLSCPAESLQATQLGDTTHLGRSSANYGVERTVVGVIGCQQKAVYVVECGQPNTCNAVLNAGTKPSSPPSP
jgi:hypothetical protein